MSDADQIQPEWQMTTTHIGNPDKKLWDTYICFNPTFYAGWDVHELYGKFWMRNKHMGLILYSGQDRKLENEEFETLKQAYKALYEKRIGQTLRNTTHMLSSNTVPNTVVMDHEVRLEVARRTHTMITGLPPTHIIWTSDKDPWTQEDDRLWIGWQTGSEMDWTVYNAPTETLENKSQKGTGKGKSGHNDHKDTNNGMTSHQDKNNIKQIVEGFCKDFDRSNRTNNTNYDAEIKEKDPREVRMEWEATTKTELKAFQIKRILEEDTGDASDTDEMGNRMSGYIFKGTIAGVEGSYPDGEVLIHGPAAYAGKMYIRAPMAEIYYRTICHMAVHNVVLYRMAQTNKHGNTPTAVGIVAVPTELQPIFSMTKKATLDDEDLEIYARLKEVFTKDPTGECPAWEEMFRLLAKKVSKQQEQMESMKEGIALALYEIKDMRFRIQMRDQEAGYTKELAGSDAVVTNQQYGAMTRCALRDMGFCDDDRLTEHTVLPVKDKDKPGKMGVPKDAYGSDGRVKRHDNMTTYREHMKEKTLELPEEAAVDEKDHQAKQSEKTNKDTWTAEEWREWWKAEERNKNKDNTTGNDNKNERDDTGKSNHKNWNTPPKQILPRLWQK